MSEFTPDQMREMALCDENVKPVDVVDECLLVTADRIKELEGQLKSTLERESASQKRHDEQVDALEAKLAKARNEALEEAIAVARQYLEDEAISMTEDDDELEEMRGRLLAWIPAIRAMMEDDDR